MSYTNENRFATERTLNYPCAGEATTERIDPIPDNAVVAMAYIPIQTDTSRYDSMRALSEGTLFPSLNKPFFGGRWRGR